jgi:hypothetical protein
MTFTLMGVRAKSSSPNPLTALVGAAVSLLILTVGKVAVSWAKTLGLCKLQIKPATAKAAGVRRVLKEK